MIIVNAQQTRDNLPFRPLIDALRAEFIEGCTVPLRHSHAIEINEAESGMLLLMPAWKVGGRLGIKTVNIYPGNAKKTLPGLHSTYMLYDATTGVPLAMLDGNEITSRRTAAASALAASMLARKDAQSLLIVGAGRVATLLAEAYCEVRNISDIKVWDINLELASRLVTRLNEAGMTATLAGTLEFAVRTSDMITCATLSETPLVKGKWLRPGVHLDLIGGFTPTMHEADDACFQGSSIFIDTDEAWIKAGDLLTPISNGVISRADLRGTLEHLCRKIHPGRQDDSEITVYKSVGTALEDLAAASLVYERFKQNNKVTDGNSLSSMDAAAQN